MNIDRVTVFMGALLCLAISVANAMETQQAPDAAFEEGMAAYKRADYTTALEKWRPLAEKGDAAAQRELGRMYEYGKGVKRDFKLAAEWYRKAADQGMAEAQFALGRIYEYGKGAPEDLKHAAEWYRKAADQGMAEAQICLGMLYRYGKNGVTKDEEQAFEWFRKAADQGTPTAQLFLASQFLRRFDEQGQAGDARQAAEWNRKAATQGDGNGLIRLAWHYEKGIGVGRNPVLAYVMSSLAEARDITGAASYRDEVTRAMTLAQVLEAKQLAAAWKAGTPLPTHASTWKSGE